MVQAVLRYSPYSAIGRYGESLTSGNTAILGNTTLRYLGIVHCGIAVLRHCHQHHVNVILAVNTLLLVEISSVCLSL